MSEQPIDPEYRERMNELAALLDIAFNGDKRGPARTVGFVLLCFKFGEESRANYISNADRKGIITSLKEVVARFEGQAETKGHA